MRSLLLPVLLLAVSCKTFGADNGGEPDASTEPPDAAAPCPNGALSFDGKSFVKVEGTAAFDSPSDLTVEAWILPEMGIGDDPADIVSHHDVNNSDGWVLTVHHGLTFRLYAGSGSATTIGANVVEASDPSLTLGAWHHVAAVFDGAEKSITLYIDGKTQGRNIREKTKADPYDGPLSIGATAYISGNGFRGLIDEVRVGRTVRYKEAKTFTPVYPLPDAEDGTIGTWHFLASKPPLEVAKEASGKFTSTLSTFANPPSYPVPTLPECPTGARP